MALAIPVFFMQSQPFLPGEITPKELSGLFFELLAAFSGICIYNKNTSNNCRFFFINSYFKI
jgi:hypothetical protein